ncbi:hypothetical protein K503DRAFT_777106, partial [Rhizopogon vinicolor AM-OR11-026]
TYLFNSCHSLNSSFRHYSSIRNVAVFTLSTTPISFLLPLSPIVHRAPALTIPG